MVNHTAVLFVCAVSTVLVAVTSQSRTQTLALVAEKLGLCARPVDISYIQHTSPAFSHSFATRLRMRRRNGFNNFQCFASQ